MDAFRKLGLSERLVAAIEKKGFIVPTMIQEKAIPILLEGKRDIVGQSQTGSGKTLSFGLPILERLSSKNRDVQAIILTPTRELALQVAEEIGSVKEDNIKILTVYGGSPIDAQRKKLKEGVSIVVGTPGRVLDLLKRKSLIIKNIKFFVLDEADEMLNMGFVDDIESILKTTPKEKNMFLFSATMPKQILNIAQNYMREYDFIKIDKTQLMIDSIEQIYYDIKAKDRIDALRRIIEYHHDFYGIIFCNTKAEVDTAAQRLKSFNYPVAALHGDVPQAQREKILGDFKKRYIKILLATDVAARGIDVNDLTHVVNYAIPQSPETYVHRIGRTGRAGKKGIAITFIIPSEQGKLKFVERINKCKLEKRSLPTPKEIVAHKESHLKEIIQTIVDKNSEKSSRYKGLAQDLLKDNDPEEVVSALLKYYLNQDLDVQNYKELEEPEKSSVSSRGSRGRDSRGGRGRGSSGGRFRDSQSDNGRSRSDSRDKSKSGSRGRFSSDREGSSRGSKDSSRSSSRGSSRDSSSRGSFRGGSRDSRESSSRGSRDSLSRGSRNSSIGSSPSGGYQKSSNKSSRQRKR
jgi:ATP-dependent RNA helicase DeaD